MIRTFGPLAPWAKSMFSRIIGHRIRIQDVVIWREKLGVSPDEVMHDFPPLTLADVCAAPEYFWDHRERME